MSPEGPVVMLHLSITPVVIVVTLSLLVAVFFVLYRLFVIEDLLVRRSNQVEGLISDVREYFDNAMKMAEERRTQKDSRASPP